jgi:hypothetical protein
MDLDTQKRIRHTIYDALDEINEQLPPARHLVKSDETALAGADGPLDSLGVVNLIAVLEQKIEEHFATTVDLIDRGLLGDEEPLRTVRTLGGFLASVLQEEAHV